MKYCNCPERQTEQLRWGWIFHWCPGCTATVQFDSVLAPARPRPLRYCAEEKHASTPEGGYFEIPMTNVCERCGERKYREVYDLEG